MDLESKLDFSDVLICPRPSALNSREDVSLTRTYKFVHAPSTWTGTPIMASNMDATGTVAMAKALAQEDAIGCLSKYIDRATLIDALGHHDGRHAFFSMGATSAELDRLRSVADSVAVSKISIEVANGYRDSFVKFVADVRREFPAAIILAGSVCTPDGTVALINAGADIARVGIGSGSVCITRSIAGIGYPQLSAVIECSDAAHDLGGLICSDGGCTVPGDVCKAFCAGADFVMLGAMFAGHKECDGEIFYEERDGQKRPVRMKFYGMASKVAQDEHCGGVPAYAAAEGKCVAVPYRGPVAATLTEILGGLRSMMTYIDAAEMVALKDKARFVRVSRQLNTLYGVA
ncbi:MAG: GMP reductase [Pseudomonadota bacterium]